MSALLKHIFAPQVRKPTYGFYGYLAKKLFEVRNREIIEKTVEAVGAKPNENVLEIGFGFGMGLSKVLDDSRLQQGGGHLYGVDYSSAVCDAVKKLLAADISSGKLTILNEDVSKMSIKDASIDKAFHVNCFYFWDDISSATRDIFRVIKPGGIVVTGMNVTNMKNIVKKGILKDEQIQTERYTDAMDGAGFINIYHKDIYGPKHLKLIFATK